MLRLLRSSSISLSSFSISKAHLSCREIYSYIVALNQFQFVQGAHHFLLQRENCLINSRAPNLHLQYSSSPAVSFIVRDVCAPTSHGSLFSMFSSLTMVHWPGWGSLVDTPAGSTETSCCDCLRPSPNETLDVDRAAIQVLALITRIHSNEFSHARCGYSCRKKKKSGNKLQFLDWRLGCCCSHGLWSGARSRTRIWSGHGEWRLHGNVHWYHASWHGREHA